MSDLHHCECCKQDLPQEEFGAWENTPDWCITCIKASNDYADYRAWVNRGG